MQPEDFYLDVASTAAACFLSLVFLRALLHKLDRHAELTGIIRDYRLMSPRVVPLAAAAVMAPARRNRGVSGWTAPGAVARSRHGRTRIAAGPRRGRSPLHLYRSYDDRHSRVPGELTCNTESAFRTSPWVSVC